MLKQSLLAMGLAASLGLSIGPVQADGAHYQISTATRLMTDATGKITAVGINWVYDTAVSAALMEGEDMSAAGREQSLHDRAADIIADLSEKEYFTRLSIAGQSPVAVKPVNEFGMVMSPEGQLKFSFRLSLAQPMDVRGKTVLLRMADPDGNFTLSYADQGRVLLDEALAAHCGTPAISKAVLELPSGHKPVVETVTVQCR